MVRFFSLYIGLRYTRAKRRSHFVSFISFVSVIGIALGVAALVTVLSVLNGFDWQIKQQFFSVAPAVTVTTNQDITKNWPSLVKQINAYSGVVASAPFVSGKGMLIHGGAVSGVETMGILPSQERKISAVADKMVSGSYYSLTQGSYHMIVGVKLAAQLGLTTGEKVNLLTPKASTTPFGVLPRFRQFTVTGVFETKSGFGIDESVAYINLHDAMRLYTSSEFAGGIHIKLANAYHAGDISQQLNTALPPTFFVSNWTESFGTFFKALAMEKTMMFAILLLIVAVAAFNLVSTLMMTVNDKRSDIAILRTMGASPGTIMSIFVIQGGIIGLLGTVLGVMGGVMLALNATEIVNWIQHIFHVQLISSSVYFVDFLPSKLNGLDVLRISLASWFLSLIATVYPAFVAARTQPAEALRYE